MKEYTDTEISEAVRKILDAVGGKQNTVSVSKTASGHIMLRVIPGYDCRKRDDKLKDMHFLSAHMCTEDKICMIIDNRYHSLRQKIYQAFIEQLGFRERIGVAINPDHIGRITGTQMKEETSSAPMKEDRDVHKPASMMMKIALLLIVGLFIVINTNHGDSPTS